MAVLSLNEIPKLKELIMPYGYTIHVHDACGGQSFSLEKINDTTNEQVFAVVKKFFSEHKMVVKYFGKNKLDFIAK